MQNKKIKFLMLVPLCCVTILKDKTLYARRDGQPNLPYSSRGIEVKTRKH